MNRYNSYKDSGVEWIGEIPEHWQNGRVKNLIDNSKYYQIGDGDHGSIKPEMYQEQGIPYIRVQNLNWDGQMDKKGLVFISDEVHLKNQKSKLILNDILIAKTGATVGKLGIIDEKMGESNTTSSVGKITINQNKHSAHFFLYFFQCNFFQKLIWLKSEGKSAQPSFNIIDLIDFPVLILPLHEQEQIVAYLDKKTAIVDTLIASKEEKINLLKENRTALINHAITKGLDPNVKLKDSGVEWIGKIPAHWELKRVSNFGTFAKGKGIKKDEVLDFGLPCIRYGEIYTKYERVVYETISFINESSSLNSISVSKGCVLFAGSGETIVDIGKSIVWMGENTIYVGGDIITLKLHQNINPLYISYLLMTNFVQHQKSVAGKGEIIVHIYAKNIKEIKTPFPPISEQQKIVEFLDTQTKEIDELILLEQKKIVTLKEYRQALISEVVTGKIKVVK